MHPFSGLSPLDDSNVLFGTQALQQSMLPAAAHEALGLSARSSRASDGSDIRMKLIYDPVLR